MTIGTELVMADSGFDCTAVVADAATNLPPSAFDYGGIPADAVAKLRNIAATIKRTTADTIIVIGNHLNDAKDHLIDHGSFIAWVEQAVGMNKRTAQDYMAAARFVRGKSATVALLPPKVLYALAAKSTSPQVVTDVLRRIETGEIISEASIKKEKRAARTSREQEKKQADRNFKRSKAGQRAAASEAKAKERELTARNRARVLAERVIATYGITTVNAILKAFHAEIYFEDAVRQLASPVEGRTKPPVVIVAKPADAAMAKSRRVVPLSSDRIRAIADRAVADQEKKHAAKEAKTSETVAESGIAAGTIDGSAVTTVGDPGPMPSFLKIGHPDCWRNDIDADAVSGDPAIRTVRAPRPVRTEMVGQA
jgi:hypothetical protein